MKTKQTTTDTYDIVVKQQKSILEFLHSAGLLVETELNVLCGQTIPRDLLILPGKYEECLPKLKAVCEHMSSSRLTCLQSTAEENQRWPLLNAVRQLLRSQNYKMTPFRLSDGYNKDGKKILRRFFRIEKMRTIKDQDKDQDKEQSPNYTEFDDTDVLE